MKATLRRAKKIPGLFEAIEAMAKTMVDEAEVASDAYTEFHWDDEPDQSFSATVPLVTPYSVLTELGQLVSVVYDTSKDGQRNHFEHKFRNPRPLLVHTASKGLVIAGGRYDITERGLER